jgi:hypothetical protein
VTAEFLTAQRSMLVDAVARRREAQEELRAEQEGLLDTALELAEAELAIAGGLE